MGNWNVNHHGKLKVLCHLLGMSMKKGASWDRTMTLGIPVRFFTTKPLGDGRRGQHKMCIDVLMLFYILYNYYAVANFNCNLHYIELVGDR